MASPDSITPQAAANNLEAYITATLRGDIVDCDSLQAAIETFAVRPSLVQLLTSQGIQPDTKNAYAYNARSTPWSITAHIRGETDDAPAAIKLIRTARIGRLVTQRIIEGIEYIEHTPHLSFGFERKPGYANVYRGDVSEDAQRIALLSAATIHTLAATLTPPIKLPISSFDTHS